MIILNKISFDTTINESLNNLPKVVFTSLIFLIIAFFSLLDRLGGCTGYIFLHIPLLIVENVAPKCFQIIPGDFLLFWHISCLLKRHSFENHVNAFYDP